MDELEFNALAQATLDDIMAALDECGADVDYEVKPGGVIDIEFDDGSKVIVNRHTAAREIWVAARSGGYHFRPEAGRWIAGRSGEELFEALSRVIAEQGGAKLRLAPPR
jgi:CyaY protein